MRSGMWYGDAVRAIRTTTETEDSVVNSTSETSDNRRRDRPELRWSVLALSALAAALLVMGACQGPLEKKRGALNEFCNGSDKQCRDGLVCQDGVCTSLNNAPNVCESVCGRFDECDSSVADCQDSCLNTLQTWSRQTTSFYESCYEETSCSQIRATNKPWNICYQKLELRDSRRKRCERLEDVSRICLSEVSGEYREELNHFKSACREKGRTVSAQRWSKTDECVEFANQSPTRCGKMFGCINSTFPIDDGYKFPTSKPQ